MKVNWARTEGGRESERRALQVATFTQAGWCPPREPQSRAPQPLPPKFCGCSWVLGDAAPLRSQPRSPCWAQALLRGGLHPCRAGSPPAAAPSTAALWPSFGVLCKGRARIVSGALMARLSLQQPALPARRVPLNFRSRRPLKRGVQPRREGKRALLSAASSRPDPARAWC